MRGFGVGMALGLRGKPEVGSILNAAQMQLSNLPLWTRSIEGERRAVASWIDLAEHYRSV